MENPCEELGDAGASTFDASLNQSEWCQNNIEEAMDSERKDLLEEILDASEHADEEVLDSDEEFDDHIPNCGEEPDNV